MSDELGEAMARVGRVLNDKWSLEQLIGVGGMAAVYGARHRNGARAALKLLHPALAKDPAVRERFLREGYAANRVEHRGGVQVLDDDIVQGGADDGAAYLVMELLEGESLEERASHLPPITELEFLTIAEGVLDVLESAHTHGVVHRDLKPGNIFLARDPDGVTRVKLLDFGLARLTEIAQTTQYGLALGTPSYMSPEQAAGRMDEIDGRTDIFALGATGFRLLTHRRIHERENMPLLIAMANEPAPRVRDVAPFVSERVGAVIDRAIAFRREDRYPTAAAMRADVQAVQTAMQAEAQRETREVAFVPTGRTSAEVMPPGARGLEAESSDTSSDDSRTRRKGRWKIPFVVVSCCVAIAAYALYRARFGQTEAVPDAGQEVTDAPDGGGDAQKSPHGAPSVPPSGLKRPPKPSPTPPRKTPVPAPAPHKR